MDFEKRRKPFIMPIDDDNDKRLGVGDLTGLIRRHLLLIIACIVLGTGAAAMVANSLPNSYSARSTLILVRDNQRLIATDQALDSQELSRAAIETELDVMKSRGFAGQIVDELDLVKDPYINPYIPRPVIEEESWFEETVGNLVQSAKKIVGIDDSKQARIDTPELAIQRDRTITALLSQMSISRSSGESRAFSVRIVHPNAAGAANLANAITEYYVRQSFERKQEENIAATNILNAKAETVAQEIASTEAQISEIQRVHKFDDEDDRVGDQLQAEAQQLSVRLALTKEDLERWSRQLFVIDGILKADATVMEQAANDPTYTTLLIHKAEEETLLKERIRLAQVGDESQPALVQANARLEDVREKIRVEAEYLKSNADRNKQNDEQQLSDLQEQTDEIDTQLSERSQAKITLGRLDRRLITDRERYNQILSGLGVLDLQSEVLTPAARVVSVAEVPVEPASPNRNTIVAAGFVGSSLIGFVLALLLETLNKKIRSERQTRLISRLPNLAYVPQMPRRYLAKRQKPHEYLRDNSHSLFSEGIWSLYMALKRVGRDGTPQVVMVTSGLPAEGKTSMSISLASIVAKSGLRVALVDLDLHRSGVSQVLGMRGLDGSLEEFIEDDRPLEELVHHNDAIPGVDVFCTTHKLTNQPVLLSSDRMTDLFDELREEYDFVVVDTPPILVVNDASWAAPLVDVAISIVRWGETSENGLRDSIQRLELDKVPLVGTVINQVNARAHAKYGNGGSLAYYGYASGYYSR
ncbi:MAG: AAA family ATPase [Pseudomonadota bacterium]